MVGYGATSKSTTVMNYCGINASHIEFISDTTPIKQGKLWGYKDNSGNFVIPAQFEKAYAFSNGLARVRSHKKFGYIDKTDTVICGI